MRAFYPLILVLLVPFCLSAQSISTAGTSFSPNLLTVEPGEVIALTILGIHDMTEVSEETWNANGTLSNGGFSFAAGTHELTLTVPGTYYYVCTVHAHMGMKGQIIVEGNTGLADRDAIPVRIVSKTVRTHMTVTGATAGSILLMYDVQGRELLRSSLTADANVAVEHIPAGVHPISIIDAKGNLLLRDKITIVH